MWTTTASSRDGPLTPSDSTSTSLAVKFRVALLEEKVKFKYAK